MVTWRFEAIGTRWEIETSRRLTRNERARVEAEIERFDREWSRFRSDSEVSRVARDGGVIVSVDVGEMFDAFSGLSAATSGAVNPLVGDSLVALGYDADYSLMAGEPVAAPAAWTAVVAWSSQRAAVSVPVGIDVGALGKGRLVDVVLATLADVPGDVVVDAGGDIRVRGAAVRIGLEHPYDPSKAIGVITAQDTAVCASAVNRRTWGEGLHHILDARTGVPVRTWAATWAVAAEAMRADAIATALFFEGGAQLAAEWEVEWVRMTTDGRVERSPGCEAELFLTRSRPDITEE